MRALVVEQEAGPEGVRLADVTAPDPAGLVVAVEAAGVGFPDLLMSQGRFQIRQQPPFILGWEAAGTVLHAPPGSAFALGQPVMTLSFGAHAEQVSAVPEATWPLPPGVSFEEAAAFPLNYLTAYAALALRGRLRAGETVLVQGAAGGVGTAAIQVAKGLGARVVGVVSTEQKAETARAAGADEVVLTSADWRAEVLRATDGGAHVAFDPVGGDRFATTLRCLRSQGRLVVVGFADGAIPELAVNRLLLRNIDVCGCTWSVLAEQPDGLAHAVAHLARMITAGHVRPVVDRVLPLEQGPSALVSIDRREAHGKLVLRIAS